MELKVGITNEISKQVTEPDLAVSMSSGALRVYATPAMIALMENCAASCVAPYLGGGMTTVGTAVDIKHVSATPPGHTVHCTAVLEEIDRRRLVFTVRAFDEAGLIGEGRHERFIVEPAKFLARAGDKFGK